MYRHISSSCKVFIRYNSLIWRVPWCDSCDRWRSSTRRSWSSRNRHPNAELCRRNWRLHHFTL